MVGGEGGEFAVFGAVRRQDQGARFKEQGKARDPEESVSQLLIGMEVDRPSRWKEPEAG